MTLAEHLIWARERALYYVDIGDLASAFSSIVNDLYKHRDFIGFKASNSPIGQLQQAVVEEDAAKVRAWIEAVTQLKPES